MNVASEDGRYFAQNLYQIPSDAGAKETFDFTRTRFEVLLKQYPVRNIAVIIRAATSCDDANYGAIIPASLDRAADPTISPTSLIVFVNAEPDAIKLRLFHSDIVVATASGCTTEPAHVRIAFTSRCELDVLKDVSNGSYNLEISIRERFKTDNTRFALSLDRT
jgi:hypothetical protein